MNLTSAWVWDKSVMGETMFNKLTIAGGCRLGGFWKACPWCAELIVNLRQTTGWIPLAGGGEVFT